VLDRERVRRALGSRLAVVGVAASSSVAAASSTGAASAGSAAGVSGVLSGAAPAASGAAVAAGLGKVFLTSVLWSTLGATTLVVAVEAVWPGSNSSGVSPSVTEPQAAPARLAVAQQGPPAPTTTASAPRMLPGVGPSRDLRESPGQSTLIRQPSTVGVASARPEASNPLKAELELLKRARRASETGDPRGTLVTLSELDRTYPAGLLLQERAALRAMATCQMAPAATRASALSEFERGYPASVYLSKVRASCTVSNESQPSAMPLPSKPPGGAP